MDQALLHFRSDWLVWRLLVALVYCGLLSACTSQLDLYSGLTEPDANELVAALMQAGITSRKQVSKQGFIVQVRDADLPLAVTLLRRQGLPRIHFSRMGEVFKKDGMISTPLEERGRYLFALSQELESTLSQIDGVVLARVHPVLPERMVPGEPVHPSSCSVLIKHLPHWNPRLYEPRIRQLIASSIPGMSKAPPAAISVVFVPVLSDADRAPGVPVPEPAGQEHTSGALPVVVLGLAGLMVLAMMGLAWGYRASLGQWWQRLVARQI